MRALVVYESMFGNTEAIAKAVADGLGAALPVDLVEVGLAPTAVPADVALLVVGGPTHAFGLSRPGTRSEAAKQASGEVVSRGPGLREWLDALEGRAIAAAAFDTHVDKRVPGSAARAASRRLRRLGFALATEPESFYVTDTPGPLVADEEARARSWAERLGSATLAGERRA